MAFWGRAIKPTKESVFVPSPEGDEKLHVSQACLAPGAPKNARATLLIRVGEQDEPLAVAALREGATESFSLDLVLDEYTEFSVHGNASIHLTGYYMPEYAIDDDEDEDYDDDDDEYAMLEHPYDLIDPNEVIGFDEDGQPVLAGEYVSGEDSDYSSGEGDEFDSAEEDFDDSDDDFETDDDDDDDDEEERRAISIEDITDQEDEKHEKSKSAKKGVLALPAPAELHDDDVDASDDDDAESEEEEEDKKKKKSGVAATKAKKEDATAATKKRKADDQKPQEKKQPAAKKEKKATAATAAADAKESKKPNTNTNKAGAAEQVPSGNKRTRRFANGFEIEDVKFGPGNGKLAKPGKKVVVKYVGRLKNGTVFDSTKGNKTFAFRLGVGEVIKGWDRGVEGMRVGDKRKLVIPPAMGYGSAKTGPIPANSELHFDVELVDVKG